MESAKGWKLIIVLPKYIPYTSIDTFLNNWEIIK
jgi:hypothetical protein